MKTGAQTIILMGFSALCWASSGQVSSTAPPEWTRADLGVSFDHQEVKLPYNGPELIRQELLDTNTVRLIARYAGITDADLSTVQVTVRPGSDWVTVYQLGTSERAFNILSEEIRRYTGAREEGHTRAFFLAALTNRMQPSNISDPDLRVLAEHRSLLPVSWVRKTESGTSTNKAHTVASRSTTIAIEDGKTLTNETIIHIPEADEVCRWVSYALVDGEVAWRYLLVFNPDGSLSYLTDSKCDAKEYDPDYQKVIKEVDAEVNAQMKKDGSYGRFGSVHTFWYLKKEKLRARGIQWRSPSELNPGASYD